MFSTSNLVKNNPLDIIFVLLILYKFALYFSNILLNKFLLFIKYLSIMFSKSLLLFFISNKVYSKKLLYNSKKSTFLL